MDRQFAFHLSDLRRWFGKLSQGIALGPQQKDIWISLMFIAWAVLRVVNAAPDDRWTIAQWVPAVLHLVVASLFFFRHPMVQPGDLQSILWSLPSFLVGGLAISLAPPPHLWIAPAQVLLVTGAAGAVTGMFVLGRNFAIFPAIRSIVSGGPFRVIRHPIYFCELVMIAGCCAATSSNWTWSLLVAGIVAMVARIHWEERILNRSPEYILFRRQVRYRLIPGIW